MNFGKLEEKYFCGGGLDGGDRVGIAGENEGFGATLEKPRARQSSPTEDAPSKFNRTDTTKLERKLQLIALATLLNS
jgi:hypothetical protein